MKKAIFKVGHWNVLISQPNKQNQNISALHYWVNFLILMTLGIRVAEERACLNCGKEFIPMRHITRQKYCSSACRYRYSTKRHYEEPVNISRGQRHRGSKRLQTGGGGSATTNAGSNVITKRYWKNDETGRSQNKSAQTTEKNFSWNGEQGANENFSVTHAESNGRRSATKDTRQKNFQRKSARFAGCL